MLWRSGSGPPLWLLHGFPDTVAGFTEIAGPLRDAGFTVLVPALPGYPPSGPAADYRTPMLARALLALIDAQGVAPIRLYGHDWGAVLGYALAALAPARIARLAVGAVPHPRRFLRPGLRQLRRSWYMAYFQLPGWPERRIAADEFAFLRRLWSDWSPGWRFSEAQFAPLAHCFSQPGAIRAALAYYRALPGGLLSPALHDERRRLLGLLPVPTLVLAGARDGCIGLEMFNRQERLFASGYRLAVVPEAGHFMHREQPDFCLQRLLDWFA